MKTLAWFLLALGFLGTIVYVLWDYRKKRAAREAASNERFSRIFGAAGRSAAGSDKAAARDVLPEAPAAETGPPALASYAKRDKFLGPHHGRLFALLAAGLPEHQIFAHASLAAVLELTGVPRGRDHEQRLGELAQQKLDFVVCSAASDIVAAIDLEGAATAEARFKAESLKAAKVRYLRWNPLELPAAADIAALLAGDEGTARDRQALRGSNERPQPLDGGRKNAV